MYKNLNGQRACTIKQISYTLFTEIPVVSRDTLNKKIIYNKSIQLKNWYRLRFINSW